MEGNFEQVSPFLYFRQANGKIFDGNNNASDDQRVQTGKSPFSQKRPLNFALSPFLILMQVL